MSENGLNPFRGRLTAGEVASGMNAARRNALALARDAELLLDHERFPRAVSLAALSIEESGKDAILRALALASSDDEARKEWANYRRHTEKNRMWTFPTLVAQGGRQLGDFRSLFDSGADHNSLLDQVKQIGFYSDCFGNRNWSEPSEVIDESLARQLVRTALLLAQDQEVTEEEIELWIEIVGPTWKGPWMGRAVAEWHRRLVELGLRDGPPEKMEDFIFGSRVDEESS